MKDRQGHQRPAAGDTFSQCSIRPVANQRHRMVTGTAQARASRTQESRQDRFPGRAARPARIRRDGVIPLSRPKGKKGAMIMGYIPRVGDISVEVHSKTKDPFWMIARRYKDGEWYLISMALAFSDVQRYTDNMVQVGEERNTTYWRNKW